MNETPRRPWWRLQAVTALVVATASRLMESALWVLALILFSSIHLLSLIFNKTTYKTVGDGRLVDHGAFSYPRYVISLRDLCLTDCGLHRFSLKEVPTTPLTLEFQLLEPLATARDAKFEQFIRQVDTSVAVRIVDEFGNTKCDYSSALRNFVISSSESEASLWHPNSRSLIFERKRTYYVEIAVDSLHAGEQRVVTRPILSGGGVEMP